MTEDTQPAGRLEYRSATLADVSFPERTLSVIVMPYEQPAHVAHEGRMITEICSRGAFDGIQRRANRVKANRDHDITRLVGKAVSLHPEREEGLVADIRISRTDLGEETLELANDGVLDVSAGFLPMPGGETWETRSRRRLTKCWLGHISLVPEPAYEGAKVLAVRQQGSEGPLRPSDEPLVTPNLDLVRSWKLQDRLAQLA